MPRTVLVAGLFHETHTFLDEPTRLADFEILRGDALLARAGDASPLGGALAEALARGWRIAPTVDFRATPSGMVEDVVFETFWMEFAQRAAAALAAGVDGVFLVLHGALVTPRFADAEGEFLARLRGLPGAENLPVFGVFDLHANFTAAMARHADCLTAYHENPHADARASAQRGVALLDRAWATGARPRAYWRHARVIWPPGGTATADAPMRTLEGLARRFEAERPDIWTINVNAGFAYADTPDTGVSFSVVTTGPAAEAEALLDALCAEAWRLRAEGVPREPTLAEILRGQSLKGPGLTVLAEPSDNIGGGAPGDGTGLLRELLAHGVKNCAVCLCDPAAVAMLARHAPGAEVELDLGGRGSRFDPGPLGLRVTLVSRGPGRFTLEDRQSHLASLCGDAFDMGPCAVARHDGVTLLLTSRKTPPFDLGQWRGPGLEPTAFAVLGVKAAVAHRRAYAPIARRMLTVATPGPCPGDPRALPYRRVRRPVYPLDDLAPEAAGRETRGPGSS